MKFTSIDAYNRYPEISQIATQVAHDILFKIIERQIESKQTLCTSILYNGNPDDLILLIPFIESELFKQSAALKCKLDFSLFINNDIDSKDTIPIYELYCTVK